MISIKKSLAIFVLIIFWGFSVNLVSQDLNNNPIGSKYWVFFHDKGGLSSDEIDSALSVMEKRATMRNLQKRAIAGPTERLFDFTDLPVYKAYLDSLISLGLEIRQVSKWINAASVSGHTDLIKRLPDIDFIDSVSTVRVFRRKAPDVEAQPRGLLKPGDIYDLDYGPSFEQLDQIKVPQLHDKGLSGEGILIAVFDTGFDPDHTAFADLDIAHTWDFINGDADVKDGFDRQRSHGTSVLSVIGGYAPGYLIGPAYGATYCLAKTEIRDQEIQQEEDNFIAALEWADSLGCRIVSASLGYIDWYTKSDLDGNTARVTIASDLAVKKGIAVIIAAGNENDGTPTTIITPADGDSVVAVGAVQINGEIADFSSRGPSADGQIKPDICANGSLVQIANYTGGFGRGSGTSFATPLAAGAAALILENDPMLTPVELRRAIWYTGSRANNPDNTYGYGIMDALAATGFSIPKIACPEVAKDIFLWESAEVRIPLAIVNYDTIGVSGALWADDQLSFFADTAGVYNFMIVAANEYGADTCQLTVNVSLSQGEENILAYPNPFQDVVNIAYRISEPGEIRISIHTIDGIRVWKESGIADDITAIFTWDGYNKEGEEVANGIYIVYVRGPGMEGTAKIAKVTD